MGASALYTLDLFYHTICHATLNEVNLLGGKIPKTHIADIIAYTVTLTYSILLVI